MLNNSEELNNFNMEQNEGDFENREIDWEILGDRIWFIRLEKEKENSFVHVIIEILLFWEMILIKLFRLNY